MNIVLASSDGRALGDLLCGWFHLKGCKTCSVTRFCCKPACKCDSSVPASQTTAPPLCRLRRLFVTSLWSDSRLPEYQSPKFSKGLRVVAFAYPYLFDNIPLFYRVGCFILRHCPHQKQIIKLWACIRVGRVSVFYFVPWVWYAVQCCHVWNLHKVSEFLFR